MSKIILAFFWVVGALGWLCVAWKPHWDSYDGWFITVSLTLSALYCLGQAIEQFIDDVDEIE